MIPLNHMKKTHYFLAAIALAAIVAIPSAVGAQSAEIQTSASIKASSTGPGVLQKMRTEVQVKGQNLKANQDSRNDLIRKISTSTASSTNEKRDIQKNAQQNIKTIRDGIQTDRKLATTTAARREFRADMEVRMFQIRKEILVRQLNLALANLKQIRTRIVARIEKAEQSGRNMTEARSALTIADAKLGNAQTQINVLVNLSTSTLPTTVVTASTTASTTGTTASSTVQIKLEKPRQLGEAAIKAVKDARDALNLVVRAIAKNMGLGNGNVSATTTASTTVTVSPSPTASVSPTPTATTTPSVSPTPTATP
jgi:hypothetical protein